MIEDKHLATAALIADRSRAERWLFDAAFPFWGERGVDASGRFVEFLTLTGAPVLDRTRRVRTLARQVYAFSHAALLGWSEGGEIAARALRQLSEDAWMGPTRGWARVLRPDGTVQDRAPDLYEHACLIFALAWHGRLSGEPWVLERLFQTVEFVQAHMRDPSGRGFLTQTPGSGGWRQQNPHMHLLEAALATFVTHPDARFEELARSLHGLAVQQFIQPDGTLPEAFDEDWRAAPGAAGREVEPGHLFEWAWLLDEYARVFDEPRSPLTGALTAWGERFGVHRTSGAVFMKVDRSGTPIDQGTRSWTSAERLKAVLIVGNELAAGAAVKRLFDRHFSGVPDGGWIDAFDENDRPASSTMPGSTLYHVLLAFSELMRLVPETASASDGGMEA